MLPFGRRIALLGRRTALLTLGLAQPALAQDEFRFAFTPRPGLSVRTLVESDGVFSLYSVPDLPDSMQAESSVRSVVSRSVQNRGVDSVFGRFTADSVQLRHRLGQSLWADVPVVVPRVTWTRVFDRRMASERGQPSVADSAFLVAAAGLPRFVLPEAPVAVGGRWRSDATIPFAMELPGGPGGRVAALLPATSVAQLDSLVARGPDTLAYITLRASLTPTTVASSIEIGGAAAPVELWGDVAGRLIWSTAWNAFVSGLLRMNLNQRLEAAMGSGVEDARITGTLTTRLRVRP